MDEKICGELVWSDQGDRWVIVSMVGGGDGGEIIPDTGPDTMKSLHKRCSHLAASRRPLFQSWTKDDKDGSESISRLACP